MTGNRKKKEKYVWDQICSFYVFVCLFLSDFDALSFSLYFAFTVFDWSLIICCTNALSLFSTHKIIFYIAHTKLGICACSIHNNRFLLFIMSYCTLMLPWCMLMSKYQSGFIYIFWRIWKTRSINKCQVVGQPVRLLCCGLMAVRVSDARM